MLWKGEFSKETWRLQHNQRLNSQGNRDCKVIHLYSLEMTNYLDYPTDLFYKVWYNLASYTSLISPGGILLRWLKQCDRTESVIDFCLKRVNNWEINVSWIKYDTAPKQQDRFCWNTLRFSAHGRYTESSNNEYEEEIWLWTNTS